MRRTRRAGAEEEARLPAEWSRPAPGGDGSGRHRQAARRFLMRVKLVVAATLASLVTGSADAQTGLVQAAPHVSPADVISADVAPIGVTPAAGGHPANAVPPAAAVHPAAAFPAVAAVPPAAAVHPAAAVPMAAAVPTATAVPPAASVGPAAAVASSAVVPPVARARFYRPRVARWVRRTRVQVAVPVHKLIPLTLPSFDMTAPFTRNDGKLIFAPPDDGAEDASMSAASVSAPVSASGSPATAAPPAGARSCPSRPTPRSAVQVRCPSIKTAAFHHERARQASGEAEPALARTIPAPAYTWIEPVAGAAAPAILLRTGPDIGLAAFRDGSEVLVVLDTPIDFRAPPIGLDPAFAQLSSQRTEDATVIRIPMASGSLSLARRRVAGWSWRHRRPATARATATATARATRGQQRRQQPGNGAGIVPRLVKSGSVTTRIRFPAAEPTRVVTVLDPLTGGAPSRGYPGRDRPGGSERVAAGQIRPPADPSRGRGRGDLRRYAAARGSGRVHAFHRPAGRQSDHAGRGQAGFPTRRSPVPCRGSSTSRTAPPSSFRTNWTNASVRPATPTPWPGRSRGCAWRKRCWRSAWMWRRNRSSTSPPRPTRR